MGIQITGGAHVNLEILRQIQRLSNPVLDVLFEGVTMLGEKVLLAGVFCCVYWCLDKRLGRYLIYALSFTTCFNGFVKDIFRVARPIGQEGIVSKRVETATGYSFPSAHTQSAGAFWWSVGRWVSSDRLELQRRPTGVRAVRHRRRCGIWARWAAVGLVAAVGFSRMYLGLHYLTDVLGGAFFGILSAEAFYRLLQKHEKDMLPALVCVLMAVAALFAGGSEDTIAAVGMTLGVIAGDWLEQNFVNFEAGGRPLRRLRRLAVGAVLVGVCYLLPKLLIGSGLAADTLAVALVAFVGVGGYPWLIVKLGL